MTNLLDHFALAHTQLSRLHADLREPVPADQAFQAKVELKLTPRKTPHGDAQPPRYQITAQLFCRGTREQEPEAEPLFTVELVLQAIYRQVRGEAIEFETFSSNHLSLARQLYPLIHQQLLPVLKQFGLDKLSLPHDLFDPPQGQGTAGGEQQVH